MSAVENFILKVKRAETPFYARLKRTITSALRFHLPVPRPVGAVLRWSVYLSAAMAETSRRLLVIFYREPAFRSLCASVGERLSLEYLPAVLGHVRVVIGDDVRISGKIEISCGRVVDNPEIRIGNRVFLGHQVVLKPNRQIIIEDDVLISSGCYIADSDEHPIDRAQRVAGRPAPAEKILFVRICRGAWIGRGSYILKGVTIGEGAIVGAASVVRQDVPPFSVAVGNPASIVAQLNPS